ncbi:MAG: PDZ domain-containing protein [Myxococcota bacterium]
MRNILIILAVFLFLPMAAAVAGGGHHQCDQPVQSCLNHMVTKLKSTGFIGVELDDKSDHGLVVVKVVPDSPAEKNGIRPGDELYALNGIRFGKKTYKEMGKVKVPGNTVQVTIRRGGQAKHIQMTLATMPADLMAKYIGEHMLTHAQSKLAQAPADQAASDRPAASD